MVEMVTTFNKIMKTIIITQEERKMATRPNIFRNKKKYNRKPKHNSYETY
jgi:hypothetical protein